MSARPIAALAAAVLLAAAAPAVADPFHVVVLGSVVGGQDFGAFGFGGVIPDGQAFSADFTVDFANGAHSSGPQFNLYTGGAPVPAIADLTVNGHTITLGGTSGTVFWSLQGGCCYDNEFQLAARNQQPAANINDSILIDFVTLAGPVFPDLGGLHDGTYALTNPIDFSSFSTSTNTRFARGGLQVSSIQVSGFDPPPPAVAPAPEPAVWGLMILGFGAAGAGLRRRRARWA